MTVLVLRPAPACFELVEMLKQANIKAMAAPFLSFKAGEKLFELVNTINALPADSIVVAVSPRAVEFAQQSLKNHIWRPDLHYVAIGKKTAQIWQTISAIKAITPKNESSEGLLTLNVFHKPKKRNILILRGNGGRTLLANQLEQLGAKVCYFETYQRVWDAESVLTQSKLWQNNKVKSLVITSGEQLDLLWSSADHITQLWLIQCQLFVPSQRIYQQAKSFGFNTVINVESANNSALLDALNKNSGQSK